MFYRRARLQLVLTFGNLVLAPFAAVGFKDFFLGDVITSARLMLFDSAAMACFYTSGEYKGNTPMTCSWQVNIGYLLSMLPFWWRLMQCLRRYYNDTSNVNQLYNAGKYTVALSTALFAMIYKLYGGMWAPAN